jgi:Resolvase, N terminal domain
MCLAVGAIRTPPGMTATLIGYARCSTDRQDLTAQREILQGLGVDNDRVYLDHGLTGTTTHRRPGLDQALAAVRAGDSSVSSARVTPRAARPAARAAGKVPGTPAAQPVSSHAARRPP